MLLGLEAKKSSQGQQTIRAYWSTVILTLAFSREGGGTIFLNLIFRRVG